MLRRLAIAYMLCKCARYLQWRKWWRRPETAAVCENACCAQRKMFNKSHHRRRCRRRRRRHRQFFSCAVEHKSEIVSQKWCEIMKILGSRYSYWIENKSNERQTLKIENDGMARRWSCWRIKMHAVSASLEKFVIICMYVCMDGVSCRVLLHMQKQNTREKVRRRKNHKWNSQTL